MRIVTLLALTLTSACAVEIPAALAPAGGGRFVAATEVLLVDAVTASITGAPASMTWTDFAARAGVPAPSGLMPEEVANAQAWQICSGRWAIVVPSTVYVAKSAVAAIDGRASVGHAFPASPAVPGGLGIQPLPQAAGVVLAVGSGRYFAGVRTSGRGKSLTAADLAGVQLLVSPPTAAQAMTLVASP